MKYREVAEIEGKKSKRKAGEKHRICLYRSAFSIIVTLSMMFLTGWQAAGALDFMAILENTDTYLSLLVGAIIAIAFALFRYHGRTSCLCQTILGRHPFHDRRLFRSYASHGH